MLLNQRSEIEKSFFFSNKKKGTFVFDLEKPILKINDNKTL